MLLIFVLHGVLILLMAQILCTGLLCESSANIVHHLTNLLPAKTTSEKFSSRNHLSSDERNGMTS